MLAVMAVGCLTSCEDILGHWEKPTPAVNPTPTFDALSTPLTFEAVSGTVTVTINTDMATGKTIEYSTDDGATWTEGTPSLGGGADIDHCENPVTITGSKVLLRGTNAAYSGSGKYTNIVCDADCYIYGNIMSLIDKDNFATLTELDAMQTFSYLFMANTHIKNHTEKDLVLPATTLEQACYNGMFEGCTGLTTAPQLPATTLEQACYSEMFMGCTGLTTAPELLATTLATACYNAMFMGCTSLTTAPELPAETLQIACYGSMFKDCSNLNSVTCYATNPDQIMALDNWLDGVAATGTIKTKATMTSGSWTAGTNYPTGWTHDASL